MAKKEAKKENSKNKRSFFKDFKAELKKVSWPTPKQLVNNTVAVVTIVIITAVVVFLLDVVFETANKQGIDRIKEIVVENENDENTTSEENTSESEDESETDENQTEGTENNTENENTENVTTETNEQ